VIPAYRTYLNPYYAAGDFSGDGDVDFAVVVLRRQDPRRRLIAVFNAPFTNAGPAFAWQTSELATIGRGHRLTAGPAF
jgi:hypothetical protein